MRLEGRLITYTSRLFGAFTVRVENVAVIGEFTTDNGPVVDDWFVVFVLRGGAEWFEASVYSEGHEACREQLSAILGAPLRHGLAASTDFASRIMWPAQVAGLPLFEFTTVSSSAFLRRLKLAVLPEVRRVLSPEVLSVAGTDV